MIKFIKSMMWFVKKNWYRYVLVVFFGSLLSLLNLLPATIIARLTSGIEHDSLTTNYIVYKVFIPFVITMIAIYLVATTKRLCQNRLTTTLYYALHSKYMERILNQDAYFFERFQSGDLLTRALGDINTVKFSGGNRLLNIFVESLTVVVTFIAMIFINPILAIFCFVPLSFIFFANIFLRAKVKRNWKIVREKHSEMGNIILESITNVRTIRAFSKENEDYEQNIKYSNEAYLVEKDNLKINVIFQPMFQLIVAISTIICYALGAFFYNIGQITEISDLVKFVMYLNLFQSPLTNIGNMLNNFYQSLISADRLNEIYNSKSEVLDNTDSMELTQIYCIEFKNFSFRYDGDTFNTLSNINLLIEQGKTIGIVGKTGSGKSTLVRQFVRQLPITKNTFFINNKSIESYNQNSVRKMVSYVPQEHVLFSRSVKENVALGAIAATNDDIDNAIMLADFSKDIDNLPDGLDTIVGEYGVTLSGGQKQRLAIARAFLKNSDILILDDSLSAVDGKTETNIINTLKQYRKDKTNIIVAHRLSAVVHADEIIVLDKGRIVERGTHSFLMSLHGWYYEQFTSQQMTKEEN
ncbi:MAG: ABC transporter ATP-binding protein [Anaeroplasma sp.]